MRTAGKFLPAVHPRIFLAPEEFLIASVVPIMYAHGALFRIGMLALFGPVNTAGNTPVS